MDTWWLTADPPTAAPTSAPTDNPTGAPTNSPTWVNETRTTMYDDHDDINGDIIFRVSREFSTILLLNPYPIDSCYSLNMSDPINAVAIKYSCDAATNTLTRNIYWDSLECDNDLDDIDTMTFTEQKAFTAYVCNAAENCASATIDIYPAMTMVCLSFVDFKVLHNGILQKLFRVQLQNQQIRLLFHQHIPQHLLMKLALHL